MAKDAMIYELKYWYYLYTKNATSQLEQALRE